MADILFTFGLSAIFDADQEVRHVWVSDLESWADKIAARVSKSTMRVLERVLAACKHAFRLI